MNPRRRKPCPGCGKVSLSRPADQVCHDCKALIKEATEARARLAGELARKKLEAAVMPWQYYTLPYLGSGDESKPFLIAFLSIATDLSIPAPAGYYTPQHKDLVEGRSDARWGGVGQVRLFAPAKLATLRTLYAGVKSLAAAREDCGKAEGRSLILGLAKGEVSLDQFNRESVGRPLRKVGKAKR